MCVFISKTKFLVEYSSDCKDSRRASSCWFASERDTRKHSPPCKVALTKGYKRSLTEVLHWSAYESFPECRRGQNRSCQTLSYLDNFYWEQANAVQRFSDHPADWQHTRPLHAKPLINAVPHRLSTAHQSRCLLAIIQNQNCVIFSAHSFAYRRYLLGSTLGACSFL